MLETIFININMKFGILSNPQRKGLSKGLIELANFILIALFFGQFITKDIIWWALFIGLILSITFYLSALKLLRYTY